MKDRTLRYWHKNAFDALLVIGRVFGLKSEVYVDAINYVMVDHEGMLEEEDLPEYGQVIRHAKEYLERRSDETLHVDDG